MKFTPVIALMLLFVSVIVSVDVPPTLIEVGMNDFVTDGGAITSSDADDGVVFEPAFDVVTSPLAIVSV